MRYSPFLLRLRWQRGGITHREKTLPYLSANIGGCLHQRRIYIVAVTTGTGACRDGENGKVVRIGNKYLRFPLWSCLIHNSFSLIFYIYYIIFFRKSQIFFCLPHGRIGCIRRSQEKMFGVPLSFSIYIISYFCKKVKL